MNKISFKGAIIGSILDIVATSLREVLLIVYESLPHDLEPMTEDQWSTMIRGILHGNTVLYSAWILWGSLCSILGGYVAACIAKRHEVLNGALASLLCVGSGVYVLLFGTLSLPLWQHAALIVASLSLSALGGYIRLIARTKKTVM